MHSILIEYSNLYYIPSDSKQSIMSTSSLTTSGSSSTSTSTTAIAASIGGSNNNNNCNNSSTLSSSPSSIIDSPSTLNLSTKLKPMKRVLLPSSIVNIDSNNNNNNNNSNNNNSILSLNEVSTSTTSTSTTITTTTNITTTTSSSSTSSPTSIPFFSGNPNIEVIEGSIHLFVDHELAKASNAPSSLCLLPSSRSNIICIHAVPSYLSIPDLIHFLSQSADHIEEMKIVRDASPNRYMVLLKFRDQCGADEFYQLYNGKQFSSFEPETCILLFVARVEYQSGKSQDSYIFSQLTEVGGTLIEIPSCPVCLERLDSSSSGVVTVLCHHAFHCDCLARWRGDNTCPVCRHIQIPSVDNNNMCLKCNATESLWICIICGHVGCSRYLNSHANQHYEETMHTYALELETQRVWDYAGDGYVHRLIQNRTDGKVLEFPNPSASSDVREGSHLKEEKIESIEMEYNFLLTSQLEQQRAFFEQQILKMEKDKVHNSNFFKDELEKVNQRWNSKHLKLKQKLEEVERESLFLQQINRAMKENQEKYKKQDDEKEKKIQDLTEELRDLRFFIEAQRTINENSEMKDASVMVGPPKKTKPKKK